MSSGSPVPSLGGRLSDLLPAPDGTTRGPVWRSMGKKAWRIACCASRLYTSAGGRKILLFFLLQWPGENNWDSAEAGHVRTRCCCCAPGRPPCWPLESRGHHSPSSTASAEAKTAAASKSKNIGGSRSVTALGIAVFRTWRLSRLRSSYFARIASAATRPRPMGVEKRLGKGQAVPPPAQLTIPFL
eukprot:scaffold1459_cov260-Pinguiococcus_pyrenoidosus.AAC.16